MSLPSRNRACGFLASGSSDRLRLPSPDILGQIGFRYVVSPVVITQPADIVGLVSGRQIPALACAAVADPLDSTKKSSPAFKLDRFSGSTPAASFC
jgi:hypothetical protein